MHYKVYVYFYLCFIIYVCLLSLKYFSLCVCLCLALDCPVGMEYSPDVPLCPATCADPLAETCGGDTSMVPIEGCVCAAGTVLNDEECSPTPDCGCLLPDGTYMKVSKACSHSL